MFLNFLWNNVLDSLVCNLLGSSTWSQSWSEHFCFWVWLAVRILSSNFLFTYELQGVLHNVTIPLLKLQSSDCSILACDLSYHSCKLPQCSILGFIFKQHQRSCVWDFSNVTGGQLLSFFKGVHILLHESLLNMFFVFLQKPHLSGYFFLSNLLKILL